MTTVYENDLQEMLVQLGHAILNTTDTELKEKLLGENFPRQTSATLWAFSDAPQEYKDISTHGGDEDYVLFVPVGFKGYIDNVVAAIGVCDTSKHRVAGGTVYIGSHA
jgi:hypothetical protein